MILSSFVADAIREIDTSGATVPYSLHDGTIPALVPVIVEVVAGSGTMTLSSSAGGDSAITALVPGSVIQLAASRITAISGITRVRVYHKLGG